MGKMKDGIVYGPRDRAQDPESLEIAYESQSRDMRRGSLFRPATNAKNAVCWRSVLEDAWTVFCENNRSASLR